MSENEGLFQHLEPISPKYGWALVFLSLCICQILNKVVDLFAIPKSVPAERRWQWINTAVSWMHALVIGSLDVACFFIFPEMIKDLVAFHNTYSYTVVALSSGYFSYDFIDYILNTKISKGWPVVMHHIVVGGSFLYNMTCCNFIGYTCIALLTEVNTVFLHSRKLLQLSQVNTASWFYRIVSLSAVITFVVCRFGVHSYIVFGMWKEPHRMDAVAFAVLAIAMLVVIGIDCVLFCRLVNNDILRPLVGGGKGKKITLNNNVRENGLREKKMG